MMNKLIILFFLANTEVFAQESAFAIGALNKGDAFLANGDFVGALESCRLGLKRLGREYTTPVTIDDTGMKLIAAENQEKEGKLGNAASMTCRILRTRIELWGTTRGKQMPGSVCKSDAQAPNNSIVRIVHDRY
jgi:hypothetical protein